MYTKCIKNVNKSWEKRKKKRDNPLTRTLGSYFATFKPKKRRKKQVCHLFLLFFRGFLPLFNAIKKIRLRLKRSLGAGRETAKLKNCAFSLLRFLHFSRVQTRRGKCVKKRAMPCLILLHNMSQKLSLKQQKENKKQTV